MDLISRKSLLEKTHMANMRNAYENKVETVEIVLADDVEVAPSAFEGMTCGEIIEALFQTEGIYKDDDFVEFVFKGETHTSYFTRDFWDSPYKGVSE